MGLNSTPSGNRIHISFLGRRNAGKSSVINAVTGQDLAVVSDVKGTTTDPVYKAMELLPLGPVMMIDTPGVDDEGNLGQLRVQKTKQVLRKTDIAVLVIDSTVGLGELEKEWIALLKERSIPILIVWNKMDLVSEKPMFDSEISQVFVSAFCGEGIEELKETLARFTPGEKKEQPLVADLMKPLDTVILVVPIDSSAPKGRLILPQQQVIRELLEVRAVSVVVKDTEYKALLEKMKDKPKLVITDSQVFEQVSKNTPDEIPLTSFSILMARKKGFFKIASEGVRVLDKIGNGDKILIAEGCTHHRQCEDIGTVKIPGWIRKYTQVKPEFVFCSGTEFPEDLSAYKLVIHCGGCMLNEREMQYRMQLAKEQNIPFTNYGIAIAHMNQILERSLRALDKHIDTE
ncbi:MAG: [Lachnospiraceae bacterium]|nr:[FeFe] hydrogenase H-cluster maturation GTPase HydF [Lachnospiraceae bacterium]